MEIWPDALRPTRGGRPVYMPRNTADSIALSGFGQVVAADAGIWKIPLEGIPIRGWAQIQTWDALALRLEGRLNPFLYRLCEVSRQPYGLQGPYGDIPHSDESFFSDDTGYYQPAIVAEVAADAALRATTLSIAVSQGGAVQPAHFFSLGTGRLHQVRRVLSVTGGTYSLDIRPPLREAVSAGDVVTFDRPTCKVRLATDNEMDRVLDLNRLGSLSITLYEDVS